MHWNGEKETHDWKLVLLALGLLWVLFLAKTPPSEGLWKDVTCDSQVWSEQYQVWYPIDCYQVWRIYPSPSAWFYEWVLEPLGWPTQEW